MSLALSMLICLFSVGILAARVYENLSLTDYSTGMLLTDGIVSNPILVAIFIAIVVCCGVLLFGEKKEKKEFFVKSKVALPAGLLFIVYAIMSFSQNKLALLILAGGLALLIVAIFGLGGKNIWDIAAIPLFTLFIAGMCLDLIAADVSTIHNVFFYKRVMSYIPIMAFIVIMLKNVYAPGKYSKMFLYISGFISFSFGTMLNLADLICVAAAGIKMSPEQMVLSIALACMGIYALDNGLSSVPEKQQEQEEHPEAEAAVQEKVYKSESGLAEKTPEKPQKVIYKRPKD